MSSRPRSQAKRPGAPGLRRERPRVENNPVERWDQQRSASQKEFEQRLHDWLVQSDCKSRSRWTPWLLMRYSLSDRGLRPIAPGDVFWASPDIWIESSDPMGQAVAGEDNFVHARIFNLGAADAAPVKVDFYWADPSLGLGPATMNPIGSEWVEIFSDALIDVRCGKPWVPTYLNGGHECVVVQCDNHILDPLRRPFQPTLDRHVALHNLAVLKARPGETVSFRMTVNNLFPVPAPTTITARVEHLILSAEAVAHGRSRGLIPDLVEPGVVRAAATVSARLGDSARLVGSGLQGSQLANLLIANDEVTSGKAFALPRDASLCDALMSPFEQRQLDLDLHLPSGTELNDYVVFHVGQRLDEVLIGGYTIIVESTGGEAAPARQ